VRWLQTPREIESYVLMFQREVADRLTAAPNSKAYGRLSVLAQSLCETERLFTLPARAFTPPPKVESAVVRLVPRPADPGLPDPRTLGQLTAAAFGQRRKMLRASLRGLGRDPLPLLAAAGITPTRRAESLSIAEFGALARHWAAMAGRTTP